MIDIRGERRNLDGFISGIKFQGGFHIKELAPEMGRSIKLVYGVRF